MPEVTIMRVLLKSGLLNIVDLDTAACRSPANLHWYKYDDHEVYEMSSSDIKVCLNLFS